MKKLISASLTCLLVVGLLLSISSCGAMTGTYREVTTGIGVKFSPFGKISLLDSDGDLIVKGEYEIEDDDGDRKIDIDFDDDDLEKLSIEYKTVAALYEGEKSFKEYEEDGDKYIVIGISIFKKK